MTALGIIGLILGIIVMIVFAYWGLNAVPLSLLAGAVICIFNGINLWTGFATSWAGGLATVFSAYYILFFVSTCFANIMGETGACTAIAYKFLDWFGKKHIITVLSLFCFLLCYGGVSFFVCMFAVGPIMFKLFEYSSKTDHHPNCYRRCLMVYGRSRQYTGSECYPNWTRNNINGCASPRFYHGHCRTCNQYYLYRAYL